MHYYVAALYVSRDKIAPQLSSNGSIRDVPRPCSFFLLLLMYRIARDIAVFFEVVKQLQRSLKPSICMATTSRFSRRLRRFSGPNLKVRRKVRQLEIIRDKRTFCARQLPHSVLFTPTFAPRLHSAGLPPGTATLLRHLNAAERSRLCIIEGPLTSEKKRKEKSIVAKRII